jgi:hypothetical protein
MKLKRFFILGLIGILLTSAAACKSSKSEEVSEDLYDYPPLAEEMPELDDHSAMEFFSFDTESLLTQLDYRDVAGRAEIVYSAEEGRRFSRFYVYGKPSFQSGIWPAISITGYSDTSYLAKLRDFSAYDGITFDVRNNTDRAVKINLLYQDYNYVRLEPQFSQELPANSDWITLKVPLSVPKDSAFRKDLMGQIQIWFFNLKKGESPIVVDMDRMSFYKEAE